MKKIAFFTLVFLVALTLWAQEQDEADGKDEIFSHSITFIASTLPEAKLQYSLDWELPFMQGGNPLTSGNNVKFSLMPELAPVFFYLNADAALTPIAFFVLNLGGMVGTGWSMPLFGSDIYGSGINSANELGKQEHTDKPGVFLQGRASGTLQMDIGAVFPGDWNHVLFQSKHEIYYQHFSGAKAGESWYKENDDGENVNGWNYYGNLTLGYQMPIFLKMVALQVEGDMYLHELPNREKWGDDLMRWTFGGILQFNFKGLENFNALVVTQLQSVRVTEDRKAWNEKGFDTYYRNRQIRSGDAQDLQFYRVAFIFSYSF
jgi:hypothetical protein